MKQTTQHVLMVKPASFAFNEHAAKTNHFQVQIAGMTGVAVQEQAVSEFNGLVSTLQAFGVVVNIVNDSPEPKKPDAVFPNNWGTYHADGTVVLYPMCSPSRRWERRRSILEMLEKGYEIKAEIDLSHYEEDGLFLEGTGSMIFDRVHHICYACLSERTHPDVIRDFCDKLGYELMLFNAVDEAGLPIYHTNVMMAMATDFVVICMESIQDVKEREQLMAKFAQTGKEVVDISLEQVKNFAGNVLELENTGGKRGLAMSTKAFNAFTPEQKQLIEKSATMLHTPIDTIEQIGGGGVRCMIAEVFLPLKPLS